MAIHSLIVRLRFGPQTQWRPFRKSSTSGLGLDDLSSAWPPWFNYWFSFTLSYSRISHEYSSLFIIVMNLIFMLSFWCIDWVGSFLCETIFYVFSVLRVTSDRRVKLAGRKSALPLPPPPPPPPASYPRPRFGGLFSPLSIAITSLGQESASLGAFRTFVRFALACFFFFFFFFLFPLPLGVWEGLRFVTVALPGLFSYLFL